MESDQYLSKSRGWRCLSINNYHKFIILLFYIFIVYIVFCSKSYLKCESSFSSPVPTAFRETARSRGVSIRPISGWHHVLFAARLSIGTSEHSPRAEWDRPRSGGECFFGKDVTTSLCHASYKRLLTGCCSLWPNASCSCSYLLHFTISIFSLPLLGFFSLSEIRVLFSVRRSCWRRNGAPWRNSLPSCLAFAIPYCPDRALYAHNSTIQPLARPLIPASTTSGR